MVVIAGAECFVRNIDNVLPFRQNQHDLVGLVLLQIFCVSRLRFIGALILVVVYEFESGHQRYRIPTTQSLTLQTVTLQSDRIVGIYRK